MPRKTDISKQCLGLEGLSHCWTWCYLEVGVYSCHRDVWVPLLMRGRWSWWREMYSLSASLAQSSCREENKGASKILSRHFLIFSFCSYETWKSNTIAIKIRGHIALSVLSVFSHILICWCLHSEFRILLPSSYHSLFSFGSRSSYIQKCLDSGNPWIWVFLRTKT